jgi:hypothetical protein
VIRSTAKREGTIMKNITFAGTVAAALTAGFLGLAAPALAAPSGSSDAQDTISSLQAEGHTVVVQNPNNVALDQATVAGVRQGPETVDRMRNLDHDNVWDETVTQSIVFVDVR